MKTMRHLAVDAIACHIMRWCAATARLLVVEIPRVLVFTKRAWRHARQDQEQG